MHYYQFNIGDWALHTGHLSLEEEAVYRRILDFYYDTELPIPKDTKLVIRRLRLSAHSEIVDIILDEYFYLENDGWHNKRADEEIAKYQAKSDRAKVNGAKGGRPLKTKAEEPKPNPKEPRDNPEITQQVILANPEESKSKANQELLTINEELGTTNDKPITTNEVEDQKTMPSKLDESNVVFDYWLLVMGKGSRTKRSPERINKIKARLSDGYTVEQVKQAIDGCKLSPYHMGQNDQNKVHDSIGLICRNGEKLEGFIENVTRTPAPAGISTKDQQRAETIRIRNAVLGIAPPAKQPFIEGEVIQHD